MDLIIFLNPLACVCYKLKKNKDIYRVKVEDGSHQVGARPCDAPNEDQRRAAVVLEELAAVAKDRSFAGNLKWFLFERLKLYFNLSRIKTEIHEVINRS
jgi:hypothetical protein